MDALSRRSHNPASVFAENLIPQHTSKVRIDPFLLSAKQVVTNLADNGLQSIASHVECPLCFDR